MNRWPGLPGRVLCRVGVVLFLGLASVGAHPSLPESVLNPHSAAEAWNVLRLATGNAELLLRENRLSEIPDQVALCSPALRELARVAPSEKQTAVAEKTIRAATFVGSLAQASIAGDAATTGTSFASLRADLADLATFFDPAAVQAEIYFCSMHPDFLSPHAKTRCDRCGMNLTLRRIPYSFIYVPPGEPSLLLTASAEAPLPLAAGRESRITVHLRQRDGTPMSLADLDVVHTQPIHLLIVDPALEDYHHEHPVPTDTPGDYVFSFTPKKDAAYRIFADVVPSATGVQEYPFVDLPTGVPPKSPPQGETLSSSEAGGLRFLLQFEDGDPSPPRVGKVRNLQITATEADGTPSTRLEPVMNAFAHLVGFYDDRRTVLHLHPEGGEITDPLQRGGPTLHFRLYAPRADFVRLFCQVQVDGKAIFAPFNLHIAP